MRRLVAALWPVLAIIGLTLVPVFSGCSQAQDPAGRATEMAPPGPWGPRAGFVYTAGERGSSITVLDLASGQVRTVAVGIMPHNVQISRDERWLLAVGSPSQAGNAKGQGGARTMQERGRLLILDAATMDVAGATYIDIGHEPAHVIVDGAGKFAYADNSEDDDVLMVNLAQKKVSRQIKTAAFPHGLRMSPDGREIYVACVKDNGVSVIDVAESKQVARIHVGQAPVQVAFLPDGRRAYVSLRDENSVAVVDTAQRKTIATVPVGRQPIQVFATPDGRYVYVANQGTQASPDDTVSVIETAGNRVAATVKADRGAHGVVVSDDGRWAFVANTFGDTVSIIDTATQKVTRNIKVGEGPGGITFRAAPR